MSTSHPELKGYADLALNREPPDLWLMLARVECLLGQDGKAVKCVKEYMARNPEGKLAVLDCPDLESS